MGQGIAVTPLRHELWLGADHLLLMEVMRFTETYRKFYLRDVQTITIERRPPIVPSVVSAAILLLSALVGALLPDGFAAFAVVPAVVCVVIIVAMHLAQGPFCIFRLHTAVQSVEIRCVGRVRTAHGLLEYILPLIHAAQTDIVTQATERVVRAAAFAPETRANAPRFDSGRLHGLFFGFLAIGCASGLSELWYPSAIKAAVDMVLALGILTINIACLVRQRGTTLPGGVRWLTFSALLITGVSILGAVGIAASYTALTGEADNPFAPIDYRDFPYFAAYVAVISGIEGAVALAGLASLGMYWRAVSKTPVEGPVTQQ